MAMNGRVEKKDVIGRRRAVRIDMVAWARIFVDQQGGLAVLPIVLYCVVDSRRRSFQEAAS